jgi:15-cis-phytoene synthase
MEAPYRVRNQPAGRASGPLTTGLVSSLRAGSLTWTVTRGLLHDLSHRRSESEELMAEHARTFFFASRFLPPAERESTIRLYAFFRTLDDLVDELDDFGFGRSEIACELDAWRCWITSGMTGENPRPAIGAPLAHVVKQHRIPESLLLDFLDGMQSDLTPTIPETFESLEHYCYQVAATVGLSMAHVLEATNSRALEAARRLGIAMQLTNILRDVGGDINRGRMYLPIAEIRRYGLAPESITTMWRLGTGPDDRLKVLISRVIERADEHYEAGIEGVRLLPEAAQMPIMVAARLYQKILRQLEDNDYDSLRMRVSTSRTQKVQEAFRCMLATSAGQGRPHHSRSAHARTSGSRRT